MDNKPFLIGVGITIFAIGFFIGYQSAVDNIHHQSAEHNCGAFDPKTAEFKWPDEKK